MRPLRFLLASLAVCLGVGLLSSIPTALDAQTFTTPLNNASSVLAQAHTVGSGTFVLKGGDGSLFGSPSPSAPIRITVASRATLASGQIAPGSTRTIYQVTGRSGDTLTGITAIEGTSDHAYAVNDPVGALLTAGTIGELQSAIISSNSTLNNAVLATGNYADPVWLASLSTAKLSGVPAAILKGSGGSVASAVAGTDYQTPSGNASLNTATASRSGETARTQAARLVDRVNVKDFGAAGDGATDDTASVQAWLAAIPSGGCGYMPPGTYLCSANLAISQPITIDAWGVVLQYTGGAGVALTIGAPSAATIKGINVHGLHIRYHTAPNWTVAATGWQIRNVAHSTFYGVGAGEFQVGFDLLGDAQGVTYCDFAFREISNNQTGLQLRQINTGFVTQCLFRAGSWYQGVTPTTANTHISINGNGALGSFFNGLAFQNCSFESLTGSGVNPTTLATIDWVDSLWFVHSRAESGDATGMPFTIGAHGQGVTWDGAAIDNITWSNGNAGGGNVLRLGATITGLTLTSPALNSPTFGGTAPYFPTGVSSSGEYSATISGAGNAAFGAAVSGDTASRVVLYNDGRLAFGPGNAPADGQFRRISATKWQLVGLDGSTPITLTITGNVGVGSNTLTFASAAPTTGTWATGDVCWNTAVASGQPEGWRCTSGGTPGVWSAMANHP